MPLTTGMRGCKKEHGRITEDAMRILSLFFISCGIICGQILSGVVVSHGPASGGTVANPSTTNSGGSCSGSDGAGWSCSGTTTVSMADSTSGSTICYRTDATDPAATTPGTCDAGSTTYSSGISTASTTTYKMIGTKAGMTNSGVVTVVYTISAPACSSPCLDHTTVTGNTTSFTTPAINASGANSTGILVVGMSTNGASSCARISDSSSNTWTQVGASTCGAGAACTTLCVAPSPTATSSHTVTWTGSAGFQVGLFFSAFSGHTINFRGNYSGGATYAINDVAADNIDGEWYASITGVTDTPSTNPSDWTRVDKTNGLSSSSTIQAGAIVPITNGSLLISLFANVAPGLSAQTVNSSYTVLDTIVTSPSFTWNGGAIAWQVQTTAASINETWTMTGGTSNNPGQAAASHFFTK